MWQWKQLLNLFFESPCPLCDRPSPEEVCPYCWAKVQQCQLSAPQNFEPLSIPVMSWGDYRGELRRAIAIFKYENQPTLGYPLGRALGEMWMTVAKTSPRLRSTSRAVMAVPIPMHAEKLKKRGFNQAEIIADAFCKTTGIRLERRGLTRVRETQAQFSLSAEEREKNLAHAFQPNPQWMGRSPHADILLIDDIYTTGATIRAAAQALRKEGWRVIGVAVVARPQKNDQHS